jgi:hypothetical protein
MFALRNGLTAVLLATLLAIGGLGISAQSETVKFAQEVQAVQLEDDTCICAEYRNCGTFRCACEGRTTSQCEGTCTTPCDGSGADEPVVESITE